MKKLFCSLMVLLIAAFLGCSSTVKINSQPEGASVYIDGELKGKTPYVLTDTKPFWSETNIKMTHPGYKDLTERIEKNQLNYLNTAGGFCLLLPWVWIMDYPESKIFTMEAEK